MCKVTFRFLFIILVLTMAATACVGGGVNGSSGVNPGGNNSSQMSMSAMATATYGAEQFHIQLTAVAEQNKP